MGNEFWVVLCESHNTVKFNGGVRPMSAFRFEVEQVAREFLSTIVSTHATAVLIKVKDGKATVEN